MMERRKWGEKKEWLMTQSTSSVKLGSACVMVCAFVAAFSTMATVCSNNYASHMVFLLELQLKLSNLM